MDIGQIKNQIHYFKEQWIDSLIKDKFNYLQHEYQLTTAKQG